MEECRGDRVTLLGTHQEAARPARAQPVRSQRAARCSPARHISDCLPAARPETAGVSSREIYLGSTIVFDDPSGAACILGGVCPCGLSAGAPPDPVSFGEGRPSGDCFSPSIVGGRTVRPVLSGESCPVVVCAEALPAHRTMHTIAVAMRISFLRCGEMATNVGSGRSLGARRKPKLPWAKDLGVLGSVRGAPYCSGRSKDWIKLSVTGVMTVLDSQQNQNKREHFCHASQPPPGSSPHE